VDGAGVGDVNSSVMREREALARDGIVLVTLYLDKATGRLLQQPELITRGFTFRENQDEMLAGLSRRIGDTISRANGNLQNDVEQSVKSFVYNETKRRPMVFVTVSRA